MGYYGLRFQVWGLGLGMLWFGVQGLGFGDGGMGFWGLMQTSKFNIQGSLLVINILVV